VGLADPSHWVAVVFPEVKAVLAIDQAKGRNCGVITDAVRAELAALAEQYPEKVFSIILHQPFMSSTDKEYILESPCNGQIEFLMAQFKNKPCGFNLQHTPVGKLKDDSDYSFCYKNFTLGQLFDGYIFLAPLRELSGCTPLYPFVNEGNIQQALQQFPDPDWHDQVTNLEEMRAFILKNALRIDDLYKGL